MDFGEQIKNIRQKEKLTQEQFAMKLNVSRQAVSNWENNKNLPDIGMLILMSDVFQISLDYLIKGENEMNRNITVRVGGRSFAVTLEDNATAHAFTALLPMTVTMNEMNGNEKYHYLSENLPTDSNRPGTIRNGDLMLYGFNCLVLFYETFSSSYSYTRLGRLDNPSGLASALGRGNVTVTFETSNN